MQASGVQAMTREARVDFKDMHHDDLNVALERIAAIAAKAHTRTAPELRGLKQRYFSVALVWAESPLARHDVQPVTPGALVRAFRGTCVEESGRQTMRASINRYYRYKRLIFIAC
jgi:hypothetical protein